MTKLYKYIADCICITKTTIINQELIKPDFHDQWGQSNRLPKSKSRTT